MAEEKINLLDLSLDELEKWMADNDAQRYRARQVLQWLYQKGVADLDQMTDLPTGLRDELKGSFAVQFPKIIKKSEARDSAVKFLLELQDKRLIETVLLPDPDLEENTLCLSSQVGCKYGCEFCFTATLNFQRNLTSGEMLGEYLAVKSAYPKDFRIHRLVFMGMGDPLDNFRRGQESAEYVNLQTRIGIFAPAHNPIHGRSHPAPRRSLEPGSQPRDFAQRRGRRQAPEVDAD